MKRRYIVVGSGQAGAQVAISLRQDGFDGEIVLIGREGHLPYQRPPLSKQVLIGEWPPERCHLRHVEFYDEHDIELLLGTPVARIDPGRNRVEMGDGSSRGYDALALCCGSRLNRLQLEGMDLPEVHYLRTIEDSMALAGRLRGGMRLAVIGGGYIGLEVAAAARMLDCEVTVIEALDQVMQRSAVPEIASFLRRRHEDAGVRFRMQAKLKRVRGKGHVEGVELDDGTIVPADVVLVGVGVRPNLRLCEGAGLDTARGLRVDERCRSSIGNVFGAGDMAQWKHPLLDGWYVLESVQNAVSQGRIVAASMLGKEEPRTEPPWFWSEQYDCRLQMAGLPKPSDRHVFRPNPDTGGLSVFCVSDSRISAVQCIDSPRDYMLGRQLIARRSLVSDVPLADLHFNLKELF